MDKKKIIKTLVVTLYLIINILLAVYVIHNSKPIDEQALYVKLNDRTATISYRPDKKHMSIGSGFFITKDILITNHHVVSNRKDVTVTYNGIDYYGEVIAVSNVSDLAAVKVASGTLKVTPFEISEDHITIGQPVYSVGSPSGIKGTFHKGIVTNILKGELLSSLGVAHGDSGSAICDIKGRVIGVNVAIINGTIHGFAIDARTLNNFIRTIK